MAGAKTARRFFFGGRPETIFRPEGAIINARNATNVELHVQVIWKIKGESSRLFAKLMLRIGWLAFGIKVELSLKSTAEACYRFPHAQEKRHRTAAVTMFLSRLKQF